MNLFQKWLRADNLIITTKWFMIIIKCKIETSQKFHSNNEEISIVVSIIILTQSLLST